MKLHIQAIAIEVTRRCNLVCEGFCMRGHSQNIDISKENIDKLLSILNHEDIVCVDELIFSGGEPCLNESIIIYTIEQIINNQLPIKSLGMVTNGHIISKPIIEAFKKFDDEKKKSIISSYPPDSSNSFATIAISKDAFHKPITIKHINQYKELCSDINFLNFLLKGTKDDEIIPTGLVNTKTPYHYSLDPIILKPSLYNGTNIHNSFYLTATGFLTTNGDGSYEDMDKINLGHIQDIDLVQIIYDEIEKHEKNVNETPHVKKKKLFQNLFRK